MNFRGLLLVLILINFSELYSQNQGQSRDSLKTYSATRISNPPQIDGVPDDAVWKDLPVASDFVMVEPGDGDPERKTHPTEVKIAYDDEAIYIAAYMVDNEPDQILREFTQRDNIGQSDFFLIDINTYNDGENQTRFLITSAGALADAKMTGEREDYSYNVVWEGEISYDENGWYAEMKIPYSALRFPDKEEQVWSIQLIRQIKHLNEIYTWNYIDKSLGKTTQYNGLLLGLKGIEPPIRLSFNPYTSVEVDRFMGKTKTNFSAGLDFKYGLSEAFTLDATLVPDFGQTAFDAVQLNLGPFEQAFSENRAFFTEGTELFTKGDLFYSRRIGDRPTGFNTVQKNLLENEEIVENPRNTELLNALKISGRTANDLGIGFFNAITQETSAVVRNTGTGETREIVTEPFANYNIFVLDQQFNQSSSVTLINTNVTREGHFRDGNVSGFLFDVFNKSNSYNFSGEAVMSNVNLPGRNLTGFASEFGVRRTKGNIRYGVSHDFANETFDKNDLGLNFRNNYNNFSGFTSYQIFEPVGVFNSLRFTLNTRHQRRYQPDIEVGTGVSGNFFAVTTTRFAFGGSLGYDSRFRDFFEPRRNGYYVLYKPNFSYNAWVSSDYRKKFAYDIRTTLQEYVDSEQGAFNLRVSPRFRFSNKFTLIYSFNYNLSENRESFVAQTPKNVVFGNRDMESVENSIRGSYNFNTRQAINLSFRNFWSSASFADGQFTVLEDSGRLRPVQYNYSSKNDPNANFNIWNLDLSYNWRFAPGSEAILLYRNSIFNLDSQSELDYFESLTNLFEEPVRQNLSLRIVYFVDYNSVKNIFKS